MVVHGAVLGKGLCEGVPCLLRLESLVGYHMLMDFCNGLVVALCNHTSVVLVCVVGFNATCGYSVQPLQNVKLID